MLLLAQLSADMIDPAVRWILGAGGAMFILNQAFDFYKSHIREQPTPSDTYATKAEMKQVNGRIEREREEINKDISELKTRVSDVAKEIRISFEKLDEKRTNSIDGLHEAIKEAVKEIRSEVREDFTGVHNRMTEIVSEIGEINGRTKR